MAEQRGGTVRVALAFLVSMAASVGFIGAYQLDAGTQWLALSLSIALGSLGAGLAWWSRRLMPQESSEEARPTLAPPPEEERETAETFEAGRRGIRRRGLLGGLLAAAVGALGLGTVWPARSLGPPPSSGFRQTGWREGVHLIDETGRRIGIDTLDFGGVVTVFPEGRDPAADDQVVLMRIPLEDLDLPEGRANWTPDGYVAFSKVCTHAGCPVGLYQDVGYLLLCPCHQATFDVVQGAVPVFGPAPRELPQLPLRADRDGLLLAAGDFSGPVGPDRWRLGEVKDGDA
ncbi:MAG: Rieske (2Fe-2S) protein [Actinobacteria bacterium]|nr:Rieske (2Fe-2S) protein [Actinomycetota bacterium]